MKNKLFFFAIIYFYSAQLCSQEVKNQIKFLADRIDSIKFLDLKESILSLDELDSLLLLSPDDKYQLKSYSLRSKTLRNLRDFEEANPYTEKTLVLATQLQDTVGIINAYSGLAQYFGHKRDFETAQSYYEKIIEIATKNNGFLKEKAFAFHGAGELFLGTNDSLSIQYLLTAKELLNDMDYPNLKGHVNYKLAIIYRHQQKPEKSIEMAKIAMENFKQDGIYVFQVYDILGKLYGEQKDLENSRKYFKKSLNDPDATKLDIVYAHNSFGLTLSDNEFYKEAEQQFKKGINLAKDDPKLKSKYSQLVANYGDILYKTGDYEEALIYFKKAKILFFENPGTPLEHKKLILQMYMKSLTKTESYKELEQPLEEFVKLNNSINEKNQKSIDEEMIEKYRAEIKEVENQKLLAKQELKEAQINRQKKFLFGGGFTLIIISWLSYLFYRQREAQKSLNKTLSTQRDQIKILNRELNHRVKNNLAFMTSLLEMQGRRTESDEAKQVLKESESRLKTLSIVHNNLFQNETNTTIDLKNYLLEIVSHLQDIFGIPGKSLTIKTDLLKQSFDAEDAMRIGLIVNELVTNSVKHAFAEINHREIEIKTTQLDNGKIVLFYKDNGPGYVQKEIKGADEQHTSIGTKLIQLLQLQLADKLELALS